MFYVFHQQAVWLLAGPDTPVTKSTLTMNTPTRADIQSLCCARPPIFKEIFQNNELFHVTFVLLDLFQYSS